MKRVILFFILLYSSAFLFAQNIGIGTNGPESKLHISHPLADSVFYSQDFESEDLSDFERMGEFTWDIDYEEVYEGSVSVATVNPEDNNFGRLRLNIDCPTDRECYINFYHKQDTENDIFELHINGTPVYTGNGNIDWTFHKYNLAIGQNTLDWYYVKDQHTNFNSADKVWVDAISITFIKNYAFRIEDGTEGDGRVMVSDPWGNGSWERLAITEVFDDDGDSGIDVELTEDDDLVRFFSKGINNWTASGNAHTSYLNPLPRNISIGYDSGLLLDDISMRNTLIGNFTAQFSTGIYNTYIGYEAGRKNTTGGENTFIGYNTGAMNTLGNSNSFLGAYAGLTNQGERNTYLGVNSARENETGNSNVMIGYESGFSSEGGSFNVYIGSETGQNVTNASNNIFIGTFAGQNKTAGGSNIFLGTESGRNSTTGEFNLLMGYGSGKDLGSGENNVMLGSFAGWLSQGSNRNNFLGNNAAQNHQSGDDNTIIGYDAAKNAISSTRNMVLGNYAASGGAFGDDNVIIGTYAGDNISGLGKNVVIGGYAGRSSSSEGSVFVGYDAGRSNTTGMNNTFIGQSSGRFNTTGNENTFIGDRSGYTSTTGSENVFVGRNAGNLNTDGSANTYVGWQAGQSAVSATENTFVGHQAGQTNSSGSKNTFIGEDAGVFNTSGERNTFVGENSGYNVTTGYRNSMLGVSAGQALITGHQNTFVGDIAGLFITSGSNNVAVGRNSLNNPSPTSSFCTSVGVNATIHSSNTNPSNSVTLGYNSVIVGSNSVRIGNSSMTYIGGFVGWSNASDGRFKKDVREDNVPGLSFIEALNPVTYTLDFNQISHHIGEQYSTDVNGRRIRTPESQDMIEARNQKSRVRRTGLIAQEVEKLVLQKGYDFDGVSKPDHPEDIYGLKYSEFIVPLIQAVQELSAEVESLRERIAELEK
ncbi:tail fiber domain-containing protein [Portibacter marinus]|uniref:tail fiber domain-containing protein n=1 Tax=Portibacter marinus TaxID=2898660 RepID=UPI001F374465|nr:tail fiber domain-containing protein [Portibacter marinus]